MIFIYKRKGKLVVFSLILSVLIYFINFKKFPNTNQCFLTAILLMAAILNFLFTVLFVRNEVELTNDEFEMILEHQKEKFPKKNFSDVTIKLLRINCSHYSSLFFIRNKNWTYIFLVIAVINFVLYL
ncbi:hypothetical protein CUB90_05110 [Clostridium sp. CT7]|uniref:hypothetical protein n=1 Tax=Clostridium sp. CT7 TaxID=2052574 RepID=UPI000825D853|nr:hypothetical protein [Clostridium sp. CT7]PJI07279.1 hypothetical protein CUB90_05110 [Clostridium sp. CT7]